jgi:hypothetical protein
VGLIHDHALGSDGEKVGAVALAFDVIEADHDHRMIIKETDAMGQIALDAGGGGRGEGHGLQIEAAFQFVLPLFDQMRRAEYG